VHRDFKPENVLVGKDGRICVTDFGLARRVGARQSSPASAPKSAGSEPAITRTGSVLGTPAYMSPEQFSAGTIDARTDQFSFCAALYEGLYRERPFAGVSIDEIQTAASTGNVSEAPAGSTVPKWLRQVVLRGLAPEAAKRHPSMEALLSALARDPSRRRKRLLSALVASLAVMSVGIALVGVRGRGRMMCAGADDALVQAWSPERRASLAKTFRESGSPRAAESFEAVAALLDDYAVKLAAMRTEACEATRVRGVQSDHLLELRMRCLDDSREGLRALTDLLATADKRLVERAAQTTQALPPISACADIKALAQLVAPPKDPAMRQQVDELGKQLAEVKALDWAGRYQQGLERAKALTAQVTPIGYRPLEAQALLVQGTFESRLGDRKAARSTLEQALFAAESGGDDRTLALAAARLVYTGYADAKLDEAIGWSRYAQAAIERMGGNAEVEGQLATVLCSVRLGQAKYAEAIAQGERAVSLMKQAFGSEHVQVASAENNLAVAYSGLGRYEEALALYKRGIEIRRKVLGPTHPDLAASLNNAATTLARLGRFEEAVGYLRQALVIYEHAFGESHPMVATGLENLANVYDDLGQFEEARAAYERSLAMFERTQGPDHADVATVLCNLAELLDTHGAAEQALPLAERAVRIRGQALGPEHPLFAEALGIWGAAYLDLGKTTLGRDALTRAHHILETHPGEAPSMAAVKFGLARAFWEKPHDRARAIELAKQAERELAGEPGRDRARKKIGIWLAAHGAGAGVSGEHN
jgi:tetratricopeptide (TPR) repeat protein